MNWTRTLATFSLLCCSCSRQPPTRPSGAAQSSEPALAASRTVKSAWVAPYRADAARIIEAAQNDTEGYERLAYLSDRIGNRLSGSKSLERAVVWASQMMKDIGLEGVRLEPVQVPHWVRGEESAHLTRPEKRELHILGIGGSVGTPKRGLERDVVMVKDFEELEALGESLRGKAVFLNYAMPPWSEEDGSGYGDAYVYRTSGPSKAAALGAAFVMVRSLTAKSLRSPHTGSLSYDANHSKIPAASLSLEDALLIERLLAAGQKVRVKLSMNARTLRDATSHNIIGELRGSEKPDEIVLLGAHIDSWDVGSGAHDDGGGCVAMMQALALLKQLDLKPKRTIRVVLFTNEENGLRGAAQYALDHKDEIPNHVAAVESDTGVFAPIGLAVEAGASALEDASELAALLAPLDANRAFVQFSGADIGPLVKLGVPGLGMRVHGERYFDIHHTHADTFDKVDLREFQNNVAVAAIVAYVLASHDSRLGHTE